MHDALALPAVRRLAGGDRAAILEHLLALAPDDRYGRFASALSDHAIAGYVARITLDRDLAFGIGEDSGRLSAFIHLAMHDEIGELGASVLPEYRWQGQARRLFAAALTHAGHLSIARAHLTSGHPAALRIGRGLGYTVETRPTSPRATISLSSTAE
ncbi:MAG TPA: hypothetical protein PLU47_05545 [Azonexus sp.]|nr:hypothetical protein [Azonexus sp.]